MWVEVIGNLTLAMSNRKNKIKNTLVTVWVLIGIAALYAVWPKSAPATIVTGSAPAVSRTSHTGTPGDASTVPTDAVSGTDIQGSTLPTGVITNLVQ